MQGNFNVLAAAVGSHKMYLDGRELGHDPGNYYCHELQRACVFASNHNLPIVVLGPSDRYDAEKWSAVAHRQDGGFRSCCELM